MPSELLGAMPAVKLGTVGLWSGTGTPESVITSGIGGLYLRTNGSAGTVLYIKESGAGNTGWVAKGAGTGNSTSAGLLSARPAASAVAAGDLYFATDTGSLARSDGASTWTQIAYGPNSSPDALHTAIHSGAFHSGVMNYMDFPITIDPTNVTTALAWSLANRCLFMRVVGGGVIGHVMIQVGTASGNISIAAYANSGSGRGSTPGTRLATTGAIACPASGIASPVLAATLSPGDWLAMSCDNVTATFRSSAGPTFGAATGPGGGKLLYGATMHPAPASNPASLSTFMGGVPILAGDA